MLCELPNIGLIKIQGKDAKKFLQGQLTCNVELLTPTKSCMGAHCTPQGRVISLFYLLFLEDAYYLLMQKSMVAIAISALKKYAVFFNTDITDASHTRRTIGCDLSELSHEQLPSVGYISISPTSKRYSITGAANDIQSIWDALSKQTTVTTANQWQHQQIDEGIPDIYPETSGKFLPHEINLDKLNAIHFDKGCYTGQEIIARMHYRGKLKTRLYQATITSDTRLQRGADIYTLHEDKINPCGMIVDLCEENTTMINQHHLLIVCNELNDNTPIFLNKNTQSTLALSEK